MIVCLCEGVSETEVKKAIFAGARTLEAIGNMCGAGTGCGSCHDLLENMVASDTNDNSLAKAKCCDMSVQKMEHSNGSNQK